MCIKSATISKNVELRVVYSINEFIYKHVEYKGTKYRPLWDTLMVVFSD